mmetsp:Transcript_17859/g.38269  ORF Transcript_17859/g.38269 Transcript_17859/m.38269 type:complete len:207 (+) Transcript_17859:303-923(+)
MSGHVAFLELAYPHVMPRTTLGGDIAVKAITLLILAVPLDGGGDEAGFLCRFKALGLVGIATGNFSLVGCNRVGALPIGADALRGVGHLVASFLLAVRCNRDGDGPRLRDSIGLCLDFGQRFLLVVFHVFGVQAKMAKLRILALAGVLLGRGRLHSFLLGVLAVYIAIASKGGLGGVSIQREAGGQLVAHECPSLDGLHKSAVAAQ